MQAGAVTTGTADGIYDFGGLGGVDSAGSGYTKLGDKFKVGSGLFQNSGNNGIAFWSSVDTPVTAIIKAEGGATCKTFTFKDLGIISAYGGAPGPGIDGFEYLGSLNIVLRDTDNNQIGSTISLGSSAMLSSTSITNISTLYNRAPWSVDGVAAIEISYTMKYHSYISNSEMANSAYELHFRNITLAKVFNVANVLSWWKGDGNANDSVGSNDGTLNGAGSGYGVGRVGQAFSFNGTAQQYVSVPDSSTFNIGSRGNSISFRVKLNALPPGGKLYYLVNKWVVGQEDKVVSVDSGGRVNYFLYGANASALTSDAVLKVGQWYHVMVTWDYVVQRIYINGVPNTKSLSSTGSVINNIGTLYLGYNPLRNGENNEAFFNGMLDEVGWFNRALTQSEISTLIDSVPDSFSFTPQTSMPLASVIVSNPITVTGIDATTDISITGGEYAVSGDGGSSWGAWTSAAGTVSLNDQVKVHLNSSAIASTLTEATLTIGGITGTFSVTTAASGVPDASGLVSWWKAENNGFDSVSGNNATLNGGVTYTAGSSGLAFSFDGSANQYIAVPNSTSFDIATGLTVSFWVKFAANPISGKNYYLMSKWTNNYEDKHVFIDSNGKVNWYLHNTGSGVTSTTALTPGAWNHIVATYNGTAMILYINGVKDASAAASGDVADNSGRLYLGYDPDRASQGGEVPFNGQLDEVKWYNQAFSAAMILGHEVPNDFSFTPKTEVALNTAFDSNPITVTGITAPADITVTGGQYSISTNSGTIWGDWTSDPGSISANDQVKVRVTSSASPGTQTSAKATIGGILGSFSVTTRRFVDLGDGTVLDDVSHYRWLKNANCNWRANWNAAINWINVLASGPCSLTDGSIVGDWHLPTKVEMVSLSSISSSPSVTLNPIFNGTIMSDYYWLLDEVAYNPDYASVINMSSGATNVISTKNTNWYYWPVRNGQWLYSALSVPPSTSFGSIAINTPASQTVTISNSATSGNLVVSKITLVGGNSDIFAVENTGTCGATPITIPPNGSCTVSVTFTPTSGGDKSTALRIASNDTTALNKDVLLSGAGTPVTLTVNLPGSGSGNVTSIIGITPQLNCTTPQTSCSKSVDYGTDVTLAATETLGSAPVVWSGVCSGVPCSFKMNGDKTAYATFDVYQYLKNGPAYYGTVKDAFAATKTGETVKAKAMQMLDSGVTFDTGLPIFFYGGYTNIDDADPSNYTTLAGPLRIKSGTLTVDRVKVK
jgi:hypothetical protein